MKYLILAEKASAARSFAKDLGGLTGEINGNQYKIVHSHGHLMTLSDPQKQTNNEVFNETVAKWSDISQIPWPLSNFQWNKEYKESRDIKGRKTTTRGDVLSIKREAKDCDAIVIATDNDPSGEGDVLGLEIVNAIGWNKPVYRLKFDDEHNAEEVKNAFSNLIDVTDQANAAAYQKGLARERFDYGTMQLSRLATRSTQGHNFIGVIRPGRLKSVIVSKVYEQQRAHDSFVVKDQFQAAFQDENGTKFINKDMNKFEDRDLAENDLKQLHESEVVVGDAVRKYGHAPKLMDFAQVGVVLSNASSKAVLDTYQKLYEAGYASYPRTEDRAMTQSQWEQLGEIADAIADVVGVDKSLLVNRAPRKPYVSDKDLVHGCNRPGLTVPQSLDQLKQEFGSLGAEIYQVLAKSYLSALGPDYQYDSTTAFVKDFPKFIAKKNVPVDLGYKKILGSYESAGKDKKAGKDDDNENAQFGKVATPFLYKSKTTAPAVPTKRLIVNYLAKTNVGTGATRLKAIADLSSGKDPVFKESRGKLVLQKNGYMSGAVMHGTMLATPKITKQLNLMMKQVGEKKIPMTNIYKAVDALIKNDRDTMQQNADRLDKDSYLKGKLPDRAANSADKVKVTLPSGEEISFKKTYAGHTFTNDEIKALAAGKTLSIRVKTKYGSKMLPGRLKKQKYNGHDFWGFAGDWKK